MALSVDRDQLVTLLHRGSEAPELDYKVSWDPGVKSELIELCKDVAAMESLPSGGHIVVGADDFGNPSRMFSPPDLPAYDEQRLRSKIASVLGEPLELAVALHELGENRFLVIAVGPHADGMRIMQKDGEHTGGTVWRQADVFVRRGTSSIRWNQHEARGIIERIVATRKEQWRADVLETIRGGAPTYDQGAFVNVTAEMPVDVFARTVTELIRRSDRVGLDILTRKSIRTCVAAVKRGRRPDLDEIAAGVELDQQLERLDIIASLSARYGAADAFDQAINGYRTVYAANDEETLEYPRVFKSGHRIVLIHAFALGALLVSDEQWEAVGRLARLRPINTHNGYWQTLLRKAEVMAARSESLETSDGEGGTRLGVIGNAEPVTRALFTTLDESSDDDFTTLLAQFDVYRCIATTEPVDDAKLGAYTNFALYRGGRSEPAFLTVLENGDARVGVFSGTDAEMRILFKNIDAAALQEGMRYDGWRGFTKPALVQFIEADD